MHGYEVMQALEDESAGCYKASPGSVYPTLQLLEDQGHVTARDQAGRKIYSITEDGGATWTRTASMWSTSSSACRSSATASSAGTCRSCPASSRGLRAPPFRARSAGSTTEQLFGDMKGVLDRAVKDMDAAWDAARDRRRAAKAARSAQEETAEG